GGEGLAVVPENVLFEVPDHRRAVTRHSAVVHARQLRGEDGHDVAVGIESAQRLVENARPALVLGARPEGRIQQGRLLPPEDPERAAASAPGRRERWTGLRVGGSNRQELRRERSGDADDSHETHEAASRQATASNLRDERAKLRFAHVAASMRTATSIASIMLSGFATPFHARSNAVP